MNLVGDTSMPRLKPAPTGEIVSGILLRSTTNRAADTTAPLFSGATVSGSTLVLTYGEALDAAHIPLPALSTIKVGGTAANLHRATSWWIPSPRTVHADAGGAR